MKLIKELDVINYVPVRIRYRTSAIQENLRERLINLPIFGQVLHHKRRFWRETKFVKQVDNVIKR